METSGPFLLLLFTAINRRKPNRRASGPPRLASGRSTLLISSSHHTPLNKGSPDLRRPVLRQDCLV